MSDLPNLRHPYPEDDCSCCRWAEEELRRRLAENERLLELAAGSSLCEACQKKRMERRIIATPRIQVEEERDRLRAENERLREALRSVLTCWGPGWCRPDHPIGRALAEALANEIRHSTLLAQIEAGQDTTKEEADRES